MREKECDLWWLLSRIGILDLFLRGSTFPHFGFLSCSIGKTQVEHFPYLLKAVYKYIIPTCLNGTKSSNLFSWDHSRYILRIFHGVAYISCEQRVHICNRHKRLWQFPRSMYCSSHRWLERVKKEQMFTWSTRNFPFKPM